MQIGSKCWKQNHNIESAVHQETGEDSTLHDHCSGLPGDRALSQYNRFTVKMVLKMLFISDAGKSVGRHSSSS